MDYAVVLYFDIHSEKVFDEYIKQISQKGVNTYMLDMGIRPHITLAIFKDIKKCDIHSAFLNFAKENVKFKIRLGSIGIFPTDPGVVYLAPVYKDELALIHNAFYNSFNDVSDEFVQLYLPGSWVPHCTVANRLSKDEILNAVSYLMNSFTPLNAEVVEIGLIECDSIKEICCFEIEKYNLGQESK
jgi:2'-5' RNA ligase